MEEKKVSHRVRFSDFDFSHGEIKFSVLEKLAERLTRLGECAILSLLEGNSALHRGRQPRWLKNSVDFTLTGISKGSTVLSIDAPVLTGTLNVEQLMLLPDGLRNQSAIDVGLAAYESVSRPRPLSEIEGIDKNLLNELYAFQQLFGKQSGRIDFSSSGVGLPERHIEMNMQRLGLIKELKDAIPSQQRIHLIGTFDALRSSSGLLEFIIDGRRVRARLGGGQKIASIRDLLNENVEIRGMAHYSMSGLLSGIEVDRIEKTMQKSDYFSRLAEPLTDKTDLRKLMQQQGVRKFNTDELIGKWPGEESTDDLLAQLHP